MEEWIESEQRCLGTCRYVTFDGIAKACAKAGGFPEPELVHFNPKDFDFPKGSKAFPMRDQHFFASIHKVGPVTGSWFIYSSHPEPAHLAETFV